MRSFFIITSLLLLPVIKGHSFVNSKTTLSGGLYRDQEEQEHSSILLDWQFRQVQKSGHELVMDIGLNNNLVQDEWGFYPYQWHLVIPYADALEHAAYLKSHVVLGRMSLPIGNEMTLLDGVQLKHFWGAWKKLNLYGGAVSFLEQTDQLNFDAHLYGGDFTFGKDSASAKIGYQGTLREAKWQYKSYFSLYQELLDIYSLRFLANARYNHSNERRENAEARVEADASAKLNFSLSYREQNPNGHLIRGRREIYRIFSKGAQKSLALGSSYQLAAKSFLNLQGKILRFTGRGQKEKGEELVLSWDKSVRFHHISPTLTILHSFNGDMLSYGLYYLYNWSAQTNIKIEMDVSDFSKINGITNTAYHLRGGFDWSVWQDLRALALLEIERNHIYNFDGRAIFYVSYFYY